MATKILTKLFRKGHVTNPKHLPHQHLIDDYFIVKKIGTERPSPLRKAKRLWSVSLQKYKKLEHNSPFVAYTGLAIAMIMGISLLDMSGGMFKASLVESPLKFDGTVYPFKKAPDWFQVGGKNTRQYSSYQSTELVDAPRYHIPTMQKDDWKQSIVNPKITYSIVYSGQYEFNHIEHIGSHPAVDIKLAPGTPIHNIANGVVTKAADKTTGFGKHVVVRHDGVPEHGTLYSSYSHMSAIDVKVGQVIKKGAQIGKVGSTGSSTTAHIHFQIDKKNSPFQPYWPFTWAEAKAAGVSFSGAVTAGVGKNNVQKYTIHPFEFIHKYQNGYKAGKTSTAPVHAAATTAPSAPQKVSTPTAVNFHELQISASPTKILEGDDVTITLKAIDDKGQIVKNFTEKVGITYSIGDIVKRSTVRVKYGTGTAKIALNDSGRKRITAEWKNIKYSTRVTVKKRPTVAVDNDATGKADNFKTFSISGENAVRVGESIALTIRALDADGNAIASDDFPARGAFTASAQNGIATPSSFKKGDFSAGAVQVIFKGKKRGNASLTINGVSHKITVLQAAASDEQVSETSSDIKTIPTPKPTVVSAAPTGKSIFSDVSTTDTHGQAIEYLKAHNIIGGYSDGSFKPNKTVSRAEAIKMIFAAFELKTNVNIDNPFSDVAKGEWFTDYILAAYDLEIVNGYEDGNFLPSKTVNRSEYFKILLSTADVPVEEVDGAPFTDTPTDSWFASYADFSKEKNLLDFGTTFQPTKGITRAEVAESIYRLIK